MVAFASQYDAALAYNRVSFDGTYLKNLAWLELRQTQITDAALEIIGGMKKLEYLDIAQTGVSDEGVKRLAQSLPKCKIVRK